MKKLSSVLCRSTMALLTGALKGTPLELLMYVVPFKVAAISWARHVNRQQVGTSCYSDSHVVH